MALESGAVRTQALADAIALEDLGLSWPEYMATPQPVLVYQSELRRQRAQRERMEHARLEAERAAVGGRR